MFLYRQCLWCVKSKRGADKFLLRCDHTFSHVSGDFPKSSKISSLSGNCLYSMQYFYRYIQFVRIHAENYSADNLDSASGDCRKSYMEKSIFCYFSVWRVRYDKEMEKISLSVLENTAAEYEIPDAVSCGFFNDDMFYNFFTVL